MDVLDIPMETVCVPLRPGNIIMSNLRPFPTLASVCRKLHGKTTLVTSQSLQNELISKIYEEKETCLCECPTNIASLNLVLRLMATLVVPTYISRPDLTAPPVQGAGTVEDINIWAGWWDEPTEGVFSDVNTGRALPEDAFQPWFPGEPNGHRGENCGIVWARRNAWNDQPCVDPLCGFCELEEIPTMQIRGLSKLLKFGAS